MTTKEDEPGVPAPLAGLPRELSPPFHLEERVVERLAARGLLSRRRAARWLAPLAAALAGLAGGWLLRGGPEGPQLAANEAPLYLLLLSGEPRTTRTEPELVESYRAWGIELAERGQLAGAQKLKDEGVVLASGADGPSGTLAREATTPSGFFLIHATSLGEAERIARTCPHVLLGGRVTVRPIDPV